MSLDDSYYLQDDDYDFYWASDEECDEVYYKNVKDDIKKYIKSTKSVTIIICFTQLITLDY